jgi:hypothetical protein
MAQINGIVSVPAGNISLTISGSFGPAYTVEVQPVSAMGWAPVCTILAIGTGAFVVGFSVPATSDASLMWSATGVAVGGAGQMALSDYRTKLRWRLHDQTPTLTAEGAAYTNAELNDAINEAIQQRDLDLGINRTLLTFTVTAGVSMYPIESILAGATILAGIPNPNIVDVLSMILIPQGPDPGGIRIPMARYPYSQLAYLRSPSYPTYPVFYAMYGAENIAIAPSPALNYPLELDARTYVAPLVNDTDTDPMPYPWTDAVVYLAAQIAKLNAQRYDEADKWAETYGRRRRTVIAGGRPYFVRNPMFGLPRTMR